MKHCILLSVSLLCGCLFAGVKIDSFCGFEFGSCYRSGEKDVVRSDAIVKEVELSRPFRHFSKAKLFFGRGNSELYQVNIMFMVPRNWTYEMYVTELRTVRDILMEKYRIKLVLSRFSFTDKFHTNLYCSNNDLIGSEEDTTYIQLGMTWDGIDVQGREFSIVVCRNDIMRDNSRCQTRERMNKVRRAVENGMKGGGAEVL